MAKQAHKLSKLVVEEARDVGYPVSPSSPGKQTEEQKMRERKYRAKDALHTLMRAAEIRKDRQLMADVMVIAKEEAKRLATVKQR